MIERVMHGLLINTRTWLTDLSSMIDWCMIDWLIQDHLLMHYWLVNALLFDLNAGLFNKCIIDLFMIDW